MMKQTFLVALISLLAAPALANTCPDAKTAKQGFVLERRGIRAEVRQASDHFVHVTNLYPDGKKQDVIYYKGLFPISRFDETTQSISIPVSDLRTIFPLSLKARRAVTYAQATPSKAGALISLELTVTGLEEVELGPCTYEVFAVHNRYLDAEGKMTYEHTDLYSPDLGFLIGKRYHEKGIAKTLVTYQSIRQLKRTP